MTNPVIDYSKPVEAILETSGQTGLCRLRCTYGKEAFVDFPDGSVRLLNRHGSMDYTYSPKLAPLIRNVPEPTPAPEPPVDDEALVERVALAMYRAHWPKGNWEEDERWSWRISAHVAIAAIRSAPGTYPDDKKDERNVEIARKVLAQSPPEPVVRRVYVNIYNRLNVTGPDVVRVYSTAEEARSKALKHAKAVAVPLEWTVPGGGK